MTTRTWGWLAAVIDVVLIVVFALIGRLSHAEDLTAWTLCVTAYPFLAGWAIAYVTSGAWARPLALWPTGAVAWILTVFVGMMIRVASGQGVVDGNPLPISFVIVATIVLGVFLIGWRAIVRPIVRRRTPASAPAEAGSPRGVSRPRATPDSGRHAASRTRAMSGTSRTSGAA